MSGLHDDSTPIGQSERVTQNRIIALFRDELGYRTLGDWTDRQNNSNIEDGLLSTYLAKSGFSPAQINRALDRLHIEAGNPNRSLYDNNKAAYSLLRYGVPAQTRKQTSNSSTTSTPRCCKTWKH